MCIIGINNSGKLVNSSVSNLSKFSSKADKNILLSLASYLASFTSYLNLENGLVYVDLLDSKNFNIVFTS